MATCSRCGVTVPAGAHFCTQCGSDVGVEQSVVETWQMLPQSKVAASTESLLATLRKATLGEYEIMGELGSGGMATVFLAHDLALDRKVAIKVISPGLLLMSEGMTERFKREARTAAALSHPHIIPIYAVKESDEVLYFVMKCVPGRTLESVMREVGKLPAGMVQTILGQVGGALGYAHRKGVVHRDIKPGNIMLDDEGWAVVTDFGIAKVIQGDSLTMTGATIGTPAYMSPEQCSGMQVTGAADQYSLGVVAYEMLTGTVPFEGESAMTVMYQHCHAPPPKILNAMPDCPVELPETVMRMLEKEPENRYSSMEDLVASIGVISPADTKLVRTQMLTLAKSGAVQSLMHTFQTPTSPVPKSRPPSGSAVSATPPQGESSQPAEGPHATDAIGKSAVGRRMLWALPIAAGAAVVIWFASTPQAPEPISLSPAETAAPTPSPPAPVEPPALAAVQLSSTAHALFAGETVQLSATAQDAQGNAMAGAAIGWVSSNPSVATVSPSGLVSAIGEGTAQITAASGASSATAIVTVRGQPAATPVPRPSATRAAVASVTISPGSGTIAVGSTMRLEAVSRSRGGSELANRPVRWTSDNPTVATVSAQGLITAVREGTARISASSGRASSVASITVTPVPIAAVALSDTQAALGVGETLQLRATPMDARGNTIAGRALTWRSSDPATARVSTDGRVTAVAPGAALISATSGSAVAIANVTVTEPAAEPRAAPPPPAPVDRRAAINAVLEGYARAIESRDLLELRAAYPGMTRQQEQNWTAFFQRVSDIAVDLTVLQIESTDGSASATVEATYEFRDDRSRRQTFTFEATLQRGPQGWELRAVQ